MKKSSIAIILGAAALLFSCNMKGGGNCTDWVAKIDNDVICKSQIDAEYNAVVDTYAKMQGLDREKFIELVNDDRFVKAQPMLLQLRKNNFTQRYINEYLFYREALKNNIDEDPAVKAIINYQKKSVISQHFLESTLKKDITVSDEEAQAFYKKNRDKIPALRQLPINQALDRVKRYLGEQKKQIELQKKVQEMRDKFKIEINKDLADNSSEPSDKKDESSSEKKEDKKNEKKDK